MSAIELDERGALVTCSKCGRRNRMVFERLAETFRCGNCQAEFGSLREVVDVRSDAAFAALTGKSSLPVLVDFWAAWCGPCKMVAPELVKVAAEGAGDFVVAKVNTDDLQAAAQRFRISSIPTLVLFAGGREVARKSGAMPAAGIRQFIAEEMGARAR